MNKYCRTNKSFIILMLLLVCFSTHAFGQDIPEEARRYMARGNAAVEMAQSERDYALAAKEFEQAAKLAPDWVDVYFSLGSVQSKTGDYAAAIKSFRRYLALAPKSPEAAKIKEEIYKLEYRQERIKKVAELAGVWLFRQNSYTVSANNSEFIARGTEETTGVTVISDGGFPAGKMERTSRGKSEVVFKGTIDGPSIRGIRYRGPYTEEVSKCTIPGDQSEFTGSISEDGNRITLEFQMNTYQADRDAGPFFGLDSCTDVTTTGEMPVKMVLMKKGGVQGNTDLTGPSGQKVKQRRDDRFIAYDNGTVLDTRTNLMWAATDNGSGINWHDAEKYCNAYRGGGHTDWRMPTQDELAGLYDANKSRPVTCNGNYNIHVATELIDITCVSPWTSETRTKFIVLTPQAEAAIFSFVNGGRIWAIKSLDSYIVRALPVRTAK